MDPEKIPVFLVKEFEKIDISAKFYNYVYKKACEIVDRNMPYGAEIEKAVLESRRNTRIMEREEAISAVTANLFRLCEEVRL